MRVAFTMVGCALLALALVAGCKRVHEFDLSGDDTDRSTDSSTGAIVPVSACGLDYKESFETDPLEGQPCIGSDIFSQWSARMNQEGVPRNPWFWSDQGNLISDTDATGGHLKIQVVDTDSDSDTQIGDAPTHRISEALWSPYYDVRGCTRVNISAMHHAEQDAVTPGGIPSPVADVYFHFLDTPNPVFVLNQENFLNPNDGLIAKSGGNPLGGLITPTMSYMSWVFGFIGDYSPPQQAHWIIDNFEIWGSGDTDCVLSTHEAVTFDTNPFVGIQPLPETSRWSCIDASPLPNRGSSWVWSDQDNNVPNSTGGHMRVSKGDPSTEAGAFAEALYSPLFEMGECETATITLNYSFLNEYDVFMAPYAMVIVNDGNEDNMLDRKLMEFSESGSTQIELDVRDVEQLQLQVVYRGGARNPHDFHLKLDDFTIFGRP